MESKEHEGGGGLSRAECVHGTFYEHRGVSVLQMSPKHTLLKLSRPVIGQQLLDLSRLAQGNLFLLKPGALIPHDQNRVSGYVVGIMLAFTYCCP